MAEAARNAARTLYERVTPEQQRMAWDFFNSMDTDRNGVVSFDEFSTALRQRGLQRFPVRDFFNLLDTDGNGTLDFYEILALCFICPNQPPRASRTHQFFMEAVRDLVVACTAGTIVAQLGNCSIM